MNEVDATALIKSDGNKQQFQLELNVLGKMEEAFSALDQHKYDKAKPIVESSAL